MNYYYIFVVSMCGFMVGSLAVRLLKNLNSDAVVDIGIGELIRLQKIEKATRSFTATPIHCQTEDSYIKYVDLCSLLSGSDKS